MTDKKLISAYSSNTADSIQESTSVRFTLSCIWDTFFVCTSVKHGHGSRHLANEFDLIHSNNFPMFLFWSCNKFFTLPRFHHPC